MSKPKKMGRPKLPKGKAKGVQIGVRLPEDDADELNESAKNNQLSQSEEARDRILGNPPLVWVNCKWDLR